MTRWFISDTHFHHANILKFYPDQPFETIQERDAAMVELWNERVKPEDHVYHLGDVTLQRGGKRQQDEFIELMRTLKGHKRLFLGNHDHFDSLVYLRAGFEVLRGTWRDEQSVLYSHFPLHPSAISGVRANVHGHIHDNDSPKPAVFSKADGTYKIVPYLNISVERTNYHPIDFNEIQARIDSAIKEFEPKARFEDLVGSIDPGSKGRVK